MSLPLPDHTLRTNCKNCTFAIYDGNSQTDCSFGRIDQFRNMEKLTEAYDNEKEFYVINALCNLNRPLSWNGGTADKEKALEESSITYRIYIDCTDLNSEFKQKILTFLENTYYKNKYSITLYHDHTIDPQVKKEVIDIYKSSNRKIYITSCRNKQEYLHSCCLDAKESYTINICAKDAFDIDVLSKLNDSINHDLKKALLIKNKDIDIVSNTIYKIENMENQHGSFSKTIEAILKKLRDTDLYFEI